MRTVSNYCTSQTRREVSKSPEPPPRPASPRPRPHPTSWPATALACRGTHRVLYRSGDSTQSHQPRSVEARSSGRPCFRHRPCAPVSNPARSPAQFFPGRAAFDSRKMAVHTVIQHTHMYIKWNWSFTKQSSSWLSRGTKTVFYILFHSLENANLDSLTSSHDPLTRCNPQFENTALKSMHPAAA